MSQIGGTRTTLPEQFDFIPLFHYISEVNIVHVLLHCIPLTALVTL